MVTAGEKVFYTQHPHPPALDPERYKHTLSHTVLEPHLFLWAHVAHSPTQCPQLAWPS